MFCSALFGAEQILQRGNKGTLLDAITEYEAGKRAVGFLEVEPNADFFIGHFQGNTVMPGLLQVEALAQLAEFISRSQEGAGAIFFFAGVDGVKWKKPVLPGDTLVVEVFISNLNFGLAKASGKGYIDDNVVVEVGEMTFAVAK